MSDVIDGMGFGWAQFKALLLGCSVFFPDGGELLVINSVTNAVADDWDFSRFQKGSVVTLVFVGICFGNFWSGQLGDAMGRQRIIVASYFCVFLFSVASSYAWEYWSLALLRLAAGFSFGLGQPVSNALGSEITPTQWRAVNFFAMIAFFVAGEMYIALFMLHDDPSMKHVHWRYLIRVGAVPALVLGVLAAALLIESPMWLATQGRDEEARQTLRSMAFDNGMPDADVDYRQQSVPDTGSRRQHPELVYRVQKILAPKYMWSTLVTMHGVFLANLNYYGGMYAFAQVLPEIDIGMSAALRILIGAVCELPGATLGFLFCLWVPRIPVMVTLSCLIAVCMASFGAGVDLGSPLLDNVGFYGCKLVALPTFMVYYAYSTEIYPTRIRSTGSSCVLATGRVAGMVAPLVYEGADALLGTASFFYIVGALAVLNAFLAMTLPLETFSAQLIDDDVDEKISEGAPSAAYGTVADP